MIHSELTEKILACAFVVMRELGAGFLESVYENALAYCLSRAGLQVEVQKPITVLFQNHIVGLFYADLLIDKLVLVELKVSKAIAPEHKAQVINYLKATGLQVALLINFGNTQLEFRRLTRTVDFLPDP